jgi:hypothetical protein
MTEKPLFTQDDVPTKEPKLDPAAIVVGTEVMVVPPTYNRRYPAQHVLAKVINKGRVWITVETVEVTAPLKTWKLRLDSQHDGSTSNYKTYFYTLDQYRYRQALEEARTFLTEQQGIRTDYSSPWHHRTIELARLLWKGMNDDDDA